MTPEQFAGHYPQLYHMAEAGTWESIKKYGLLSTSALLDLFEISDSDRKNIESKRRPKMVSISHKKHGSAMIRDNGPLKDGLLKESLIDMTPTNWLKLLNKMVFFWPTKERVLTLLSARAYRNRKHTVITVDTKKLLSKYTDKVKLSRINSGATVYQPTPRGSETFVRIPKWPNDVGPRSGKLKKKVAELAVEYCVSDISDFAVRVDEMHKDAVVKELWKR